VVVVVMAEHDPPHVVRIDDRTDSCVPAEFVGVDAGVEHDRLAAGEHHRVDVDPDRGAGLFPEALDQVSLGRDLNGTDELVHRRCSLLR
jgi:hypothetical protein